MAEVTELRLERVTLGFGFFESLFKFSARCFPKVNKFILDPVLRIFSCVQHLDLLIKLPDLAIKVTSHHLDKFGLILVLSLLHVFLALSN